MGKFKTIKEIEHDIKINDLVKEEKKPNVIYNLTPIDERVPEFKETVELIDMLSHSIIEVQTKFLSHMRKPYLSYDYEIDNVKYELRPAFTIEEQVDQERMRREIFKILMKEALCDFVDKMDEEIGQHQSDNSFKFIIHPMNVPPHEALQDKFAKDTENLQKDTQPFSKDYEEILRDNPKYFLEQAFNFIHLGPDSIDEELLEFGSFRRVLHNYMVSDECTAERDRRFNMKTVDYFPELIKGNNE